MLEFDFDKIYLAIALFSTTLFIFKTIFFVLLGGDAEVNADFDSITEADTSFSFFSVQTLLAFFMGFGWMGLVVLQQLKISAIYVAIFSCIVGLLFMFITAYLMFLTKKLNKTVRVNYADCVGQEGKAYTTFEPNSNGKIEITLNQKLVIIDAISVSNEKINAFEIIKVIKFENNKVYIDKI